MFGPADDLILEILTEIVEIIAVPGNPYDKIPVHLRMFLCIPECSCINDIELDVMTIHTEITPYQCRQAIIAVLILEKLWCKFLVQKSAPCAEMVNF